MLTLLGVSQVVPAEKVETLNISIANDRKGGYGYLIK